MTLEHAKEVIRYGLVGTAAAAVYFLGSNGLDALGLPVWASAGLGWLVGVTVSYLGHLRVTFRVMPDHLKRVQRFAVLCALNFGLTELITYGVHGYLEKSYAVASACVTVAIPLMSYPLSKFWVFRK